jgi:hypothetical protein
LRASLARAEWVRPARPPARAQALCDFLIYSEHNLKLAMDLAAAATKTAE